jgi:predicted Zn-dependent protease
VIFIALAIVVGVGLGLFFRSFRPGVPAAPPGRTLHFAPIGDFPAADAQALVAHYRDRFGLEIDVLPTIPMPPEAMDLRRRQVIAERLTEAIRGQPIAADHNAVIIGLTSADMYIASATWNYAYGMRQGDRWAVVSSARMSAGFADETLRMARLQKMITKNIGILYYLLPDSTDPRSVLYNNILGPDDLDRMTEEF